MGEVVLEDWRILNRELVRTGNAWWYYQYSDDRELRQLELGVKLGVRHTRAWMATYQQSTRGHWGI